MAHALAGAFQQAGRIVECRPVEEADIHMGAESVEVCGRPHLPHRRWDGRHAEVRVRPLPARRSRPRRQSRRPPQIAERAQKTVGRRGVGIDQAVQAKAVFQRQHDGGGP